MTRLVIYILDTLIRVYQKIVSPLLGKNCRFYPSCSEYAKICIHNYSLFQAFSKITWRILRCNPLSSGGLDQP